MTDGSTRDAIIQEAWYPNPGAYWVPAAEADAWPYRYGDLFHAPATDAHGTPLTGAAGAPWEAVMTYSPSCELATKAKPTDTVEVVRVLRLDTQDPAAAQRIIVGWEEKDAVISIAFAHTIFLAAVPSHPTHDHPMFANLKATTRVTVSDLHESGRIAALTHDARVSVIRRDLYYRYRWILPTSEVKAVEQARISTDPHFAPPRPDWAHAIVT